jgi:probable H4MPT-linked C1 transfer pathway protein
MAERLGPDCTVGWDVGGAHVKACVVRAGRVRDVLQWPCALWQGLDRLQAVLAQAQQRWPGLPQASHALTMSGEMCDLFADRQQGVQAIADAMASGLADPATGAPPLLRLFAGAGDWRRPDDAGTHWAAIASVNWLATAQHAARRYGHGVLIDIGSTTTDLIAFGDGQVRVQGRDDAGRLASGELVYHGVARTPLCALGPRVPWQGRTLNIMNEWFATSADVHRLLGDLNPAHDQHPAADQGAKTPEATRSRLARMIGLDARDGSVADWEDLARHWRRAQVTEIAGQLRRVVAQQPLQPSQGAVVVSAGCGDFLVPAVLDAAGLDWPVHRYGQRLAPMAEGSPPEAADWAQVAAPAVAVACLCQMEQR